MSKCHDGYVSSYLLFLSDNEDNIELDDVLIYLNLNDKTETDSLFVQAIQAKDFYVLCKF